MAEKKHTSTYEWQLETCIGQYKAFNKALKERYLNAEDNWKASLLLWKLEGLRLQRLAAASNTATDATTLKYHEKAMEGLELKKANLSNGKQGLLDTIHLTASQIFGYFDELIGDYHDNSIDKEELKKYLTIIREIFELNYADLALLKSDKAIEMKSFIENTFKSKPNAKLSQSRK